MIPPLVPRGSALLVSVPSSIGVRGGLLRIDRSGVAWIDDERTLGLALDGEELLRITVEPREDGKPDGSLSTYGPDGLRQTIAMTDVRYPHDILAHADGYLIAATGGNEIVAVDRDGATRIWWAAPHGEPDSWHLNCLTDVRGDVYVTAFGRYNAPREWEGRFGAGDGVLVRVATGEDVVVGLNAPHDARMIDGVWAICNSWRGELVRADPRTGRIVQTIAIGGWTQALLVTDDVVFVGSRAHRTAGGDAKTAQVTALDRLSFELLGRTQLPVRTLYDLVLVPAELAAAVEACA